MIDDSSDAENNPFLSMSAVSSERERREIRNKYRELINDTSAEGEEEGRMTIREITSKLHEAADLFHSGLHMTRESALGTKFLSILSSRATIAAKSLDTSVLSFIPSEFAEKLAYYVSPDERTIDWSDFGKKTAVFFKRSPAFHCMMGSYEPPVAQQSQKPSQNRVAKEKSTEITKVSKVSEIENQYEEATTEEVENVLKHLRSVSQKNGGMPICYYEFVMDPSSFTQTILNMFHVTFLVKDSYAKVYFDEDNLPVIEPVVESATNKSGSAEKEKKQVLLSMNKQEWEEIIDVFGIRRALIQKTKGAAKK